MPFNDFFNRLFGSGDASLSCHTLKRSEKYLTAFNAWVAGKVYLNWTQPFFKAYHYQKSGISNAAYRVQLVDESNLKGAVLYYHTDIGPKNFCFLFELIRHRVQEAGYLLHSSDTRKVSHQRYKEQVERYVLTPPPATTPDTDLCDQLYGNIHIDCVYVNKLPGYIRFVTNTYADPYFSKALPFADLLEMVLQPNEQQV